MARILKLFLLLFALGSIRLYGNDISTLPLPQNSFCVGEEFNLSYTVSAAFNAGNTFTAELSDAGGSFASPTLIGSVTGTASGNISCTIPAGTPQGNAYRIRVSGSNPVVNGTDNGINITIHASPSVSLPSLTDVCESNSAFAITGGSPAGGLYSGTGIINNSFYPALIGAGNYLITYTYTDANGCQGSASTNITVNPNPVVTLSISGTFCSNGNAVALTGGSPAGGTYTGTGVAGSTFIPSLAGAGSHNITYSYTDAVSGCSALATQSVFVQPVAPVIFNIPSSVCENSGNITLSAVPSGGTFSGTGVNGNNFDPSLAGAGVHTITYSVTNANGCVSSSSQNITVNANPVVTLAPFASICSGNGSVVLSGGLPSGGVYSGTGVVNGSFYPGLSGAGTFTILYVYTDQNGCQSSDNQNITVNNAPVVSFAPPQTSCLGGAAITLNASPAGGVFSGPGVNGNTFDPQVAGLGSWVLSYNYTDGNGCSASASAPITVVSFGAATINPIPPVCENAGNIVLTYTPAGGILSGAGIQNGIFNPAAAGPGTHEIIYSISTGNGCTSADTVSIVVHPLPQVLLNTQTEYCSNSGGQVLSGGVPLGGVYSGQAVVNGSFFPGVAGVGTTLVTYAYTDVNGCSASVSSPVAVYAAPTPSLSSFQDVCVNAPDFLLSGGLPAGGIYSGTGVVNNVFSPSNAGPGFYQITYTLTDTNNCIGTAGANLQVYNLSLDAGSNDTISCGNSVQLQPSVVYNGTNILNYSWTPSTGLSSSNAISPIATPTATTTYFLSVDDGSCSIIDSVTVIVNPANFSLAFTQNQQVFTQPPFAVTFINNTPSLANYTFTWIMGDGTVITNNSQVVTYQYFNDGVYDVTLIAVDNATGCSDTLFRPQWISCSGNCTHQAQINQTGPITVCSGSGVTLTCNTDPSFDSYQWNFNGLPITGADTSSYTATQQGFYSVTITDNGCARVSSSIFIQLLPSPPTPNISLSSALNPCSGTPAVLSTLAGYPNYNWRRIGDANLLPSTSSTLITNTTGFYNVTIFDVNGCSSTSPDFPLNYSYLFPGELCIVTYNTLDNNGQNTIVWDQPLTTSISEYKILRETNAANVYDTVGTVPYGALSEFIDTAQAFNPNISAYSYRLALVDTCGGTTLPGGRHRTMHLTINAGIGGSGQQVWNLIWSSYEGASFGTYYIYRTNDSINFNWTLIGSIAAGSNPFNSFTDINPPVGYNGYQIVIDLPQPCESIERAQYNKTRSNVGSNLVITGTQKYAQENLIQIYPNPNNGQATLFLSGLNPGQAELELTDMFGRRVLQKGLGIMAHQQQVELDFENLETGMYNIRIVQGDKQISRKMIINR